MATSTSDSTESSSGSKNKDSTNIIRYAEYIEERHKVFLNDTYSYRIAAIAGNPYNCF